MPLATVSRKAIKCNLKSNPELWVSLRPMSYGDKLHKTEIATQQSANIGDGDMQMAIQIAQRASQQFEFEMCIVDHNLEKEIENNKGEKSLVPINFSDPDDLYVLDPIVGEEIATLIDNMNNFEPDKVDGSGN